MNDAKVTILMDKEVKRKAIFVVKCKGSNLSAEVRKAVEALADEFDSVK